MRNNLQKRCNRSMGNIHQRPWLKRTQKWACEWASMSYCSMPVFKDTAWQSTVRLIYIFSLLLFFSCCLINDCAIGKEASSDWYRQLWWQISSFKRHAVEDQKKKKRSSSKNQESLGEELHYYRYNSSISFLPPPTELAVCLGGASVPVSVAWIRW